MNEAMRADFESKNQIRGIHKNLDGSYIDAIQQAKWEGYQSALSQQPITSCNFGDAVRPNIIDCLQVSKPDVTLIDEGNMPEQHHVPQQPAQPSCEPVAIVDRRVIHGSTCVFIERMPSNRDIPDKTLLYAAPPNHELLKAALTRCRNFADTQNHSVNKYHAKSEVLRAENAQLKETEAMLRGLISEAEEMLIRVISERDTAKESNKSMAQTLNYVERWANHHAVKPTMTAAEALSCIQHYPRILDITRGYEDGKVPLTPNPFSERDLAMEHLDALTSREQWIHDNSKTVGGGHGFTVTFFVPVDHEDIFCGISEAIKLEQK